MTNEARQKAISEALSAEDSNMNAERHLIPWKDSTEKCTVIEVDLDVVLLNPRSHRIRAQLESRPDRASVEEAPPGGSMLRVPSAQSSD